MFRPLLILLFLSLQITFSGQNLVLNPSFENYSECPTTFSQIDRADPWISPALGLANISTDFFHSCLGTGEDGDCMVCVPENMSGEQVAHTGEGYAGFFCHLDFSSPFTMTTNELIQGTFVSSLEAGEIYDVSFWVNLSDYSGVAIENFDVYISQDQVQNGFTIPWTPSYTTSGEWYTDKDDWMEISFQYEANGGEQYITIGNFTHYFYSPTLAVNGGVGDFAYYHIDDVSVSLPYSEPEAYLEGTLSICQGEEGTITAYNADSWSWTSSADLDAVISTDSILTVSPEVSTTYIFEDGDITLTHQIDVIPLPNTELGGDQHLCEGESLSLENIVDLNNYLWQDGSIESNLSVDNSGWYSLESTNNGCSNIDSVLVEFHEPPIVNLGDDFTICDGEEVLLEFENNEDYIISWNTGETDNFIFTSESGIYGFEAFDGYCEFSDSIQIIFEDCAWSYSLPNIFTPDGSGFNDLFVPLEINRIVYSNVKIFGRWGNLVFETEDLMIQWDGRDMNGEEVPEGTYYYISVVGDMFGEEHGFTGVVTLLRK